MTLLPRFAIAMIVLAIASESHAQLRGPKGDSPDEKRALVRQQRDEMLQHLFSAMPDMKEGIKTAVGYATFKTRDVNLLLLASGSGYGLLVDNQNGKETYMRVASLGAGIGMGISDLRLVFVFRDRAFMESFVRDGWQFGGEASAAAKYKDTGVAADQAVTADPDFHEGTVAAAGSAGAQSGVKEGPAAEGGTNVGGAMEIYQFTESGVSLQATVSGTKYWQDKKLNE